MEKRWIAGALTLAVALLPLAGPVSLATSVGRTSETQVSRDGLTEPIVIPEFGDATSPSDRCRCDNDTFTVGLTVRWGYLDDPAVAFLAGRWRWNDDGSGRNSNPSNGSFSGHWRLLDRRIGGSLWGDFRIPDDGRGAFRGQWNVTGPDRGGYLWGDWVRVERAQGSFSGHWNISSGRPGGALAGAWDARSEEGGSFRGRGIAAPSLDPVSWDGQLNTEAGSVRVLRTVRWEGYRRGGEDFVYPQTDRQTVEWRSTTTVNWDGLVFGLRIPKNESDATVTLRTEQISFTWKASELRGLHLRERVDDAGHAIEVVGFTLERHRDRDVARISIGIRWGFLTENGTDDPSRDATDWSGGARISEGGIAGARAISFERGDEMLRRENRQTVRWVSHTTTGWDGVLMIAYVPVGHLEGAEFTLHAGAFSQTFTLREIAGHHVFDVGSEGHQLEVRMGRA